MRHRKDLTPADFHLASRFKAYLVRYMASHKVKRGKDTRQQSWKEQAGKWIPEAKETDSTPALVIPLSDFRAICRGIRREIEGCTEGRIVAALEKLSLFRYGKANHWKSGNDGETVVLLEHHRLAGDGTIQKRKAYSKAENLEKVLAQVDAVAADYVKNQGATVESAVKVSRDIYNVKAHEDLCEAAKEAKRQRQEEVKNLIKRKV